MASKTEEVLANRVEQLERELEDLREERDREQRCKDHEDAYGWTRPFQLTSGDYDKISDERNYDLPVPRLEIRWIPKGEGYAGTRIARYSLVYRHLLGQVIAVPLGQTRQSGGPWEEFERVEDMPPGMIIGRLSPPFRDGAHALNEAKQLNLSLFVLDEGICRWVEIDTTKKSWPEIKIEQVQELREEEDTEDE